ncbi:Gx transporter family protein [Mediterraneibacter sp.]|uniref:Gx transporter family protein n=1 Tax=Mediterraneibacter sp. TaxID=2316022 RepID=UPI0015AC99B1|nr:Gx transporter family protein [Mediterraneibacter sp.]
MRNRAAYFGIFTALALILGYVEMLIPIQFGIPGVKLGLANLVTILVLYKMGWKDALLLSVVRIVLGGFIFSNLFAVFYSLAGGLLSLSVMGIVKKTGKFSVVGVSIWGGIFHNIGQLAVAMAVVQTYEVGYYFPVLLVAGLLTGMVIGILSGEVLKRIKNLRLKE